MGGNDAGILCDVLGFTVQPPIRPLLDAAILTSCTRHVQAGQLVPRNTLRAGRPLTYTPQCCSCILVPRCRFPLEGQHSSPQVADQAIGMTLRIS